MTTSSSSGGAAHITADGGLIDESGFHVDPDQMGSDGRMGVADYARTLPRYAVDGRGRPAHRRDAGRSH